MDYREIQFSTILIMKRNAFLSNSFLRKAPEYTERILKYRTASE